MKNYIKFLFDLDSTTGDRRHINEFVSDLLSGCAWMDEAKRKSQRAIFLAAAERGMTDLLNALSAFDVDVNQSGAPLHFAVLHGKVELVRFLLSSDSDTGMQDKDGWTALHYAAAVGDVAMLTLLLAAKADATIKDIIGREPLHYASRNGNVEIVRVLISEKIDVNAVDNMGWTGLHLAAKNAYVEIVEMFLVAKASWTIQDVEGRTAVDYALLPSEDTMVKASLIEALKNAGADVERRDKAQRTSLHRAALFKENSESALVIIQTLVECDVDLDAADEYGERALHFAVGGRKWDAARLLLTLGANLRLSNKNGIMPLDLLVRLEPRFEEARQIVGDLYMKAAGDDWPVL
jgi:ankyrin repeat protein